MTSRTILVRGVRIPRWVLVVCILQVGVSLVALGVHPVPTRLGFHMYAGTGGPEVTATDAAGNEVDVDGLHPYMRQDLPYVDHLPEFICERLDEVVEVTVAQQGRERTLVCP